LNAGAAEAVGASGLIRVVSKAAARAVVNARKMRFCT
jgi:hypothetical protein